MKTLNQLKNQFGEILSREELKSISGGDVPINGNIYCDIGGEQKHCDNEDIDWCLWACQMLEGVNGTPCGGCYQFPKP